MERSEALRQAEWSGGEARGKRSEWSEMERSERQLAERSATERSGALPRAEPKRHEAEPKGEAKRNGGVAETRRPEHGIVTHST